MNLSPDVIFLGERFQVKVAGFRGLNASARRLAIAPSAARYLAPEQLRKGRVDARADIYTVGLLLLESLLARSPFLADNPEELVREILEDGPIPVRRGRAKCPAMLSAVVDMAVQIARRDRYGSAAEMFTALAGAYEQLPERKNHRAPAPYRPLPVRSWNFDTGSLTPST